MRASRSVAHGLLTAPWLKKELTGCQKAIEYAPSNHEA